MEKETIKMNVYNAIVKEVKETLSGICKIKTIDGTPALLIIPEEDISEEELIPTIHEVFLTEKCCYNYTEIVVKNNNVYINNINEINESDVSFSINCTINKIKKANFCIDFTVDTPHIYAYDSMIYEAYISNLKK